jgi:hypothetical protein
VSDTQASLTVARRFCGPPASGNGGYVAGLLAPHVHATDPVTVTLRTPPPLDVAMQVGSGDDGVRLSDGDLLIAEATTGSLIGDPVVPVSVDEAYAAHEKYQGLDDPTFQSCFVCGLSREDGLRLMSGPTSADSTACVWTPDVSLAASSDPDAAAFEFVWAALDCPGGWTTDMLARPLVLGRMTAQVQALPRIGEPVVVVGQHTSTSGRKTMTSTSAYAPDGALLGRAEQIWIAIDGDVFYPT